MAVMHFSGKVSDCFGLSCGDIEYDGYVPHGLGIGGGDYIQIVIDLDTGTIVNWCGLTEADVAKACFGDEVEDDE